ncbi:MAG: flagellar biosynthetic protein FliO [Oscillospiraceae bacterium]|nr:flagellar biosynthetic protein FliO [Oscillospiraceae bacterium]
MLILILTSEPSGLRAANGYMGTILGFAAFIALIVLSYLVLRWLSKRAMGNTRHIRVIERMAVTRDAGLWLIEIGRRVLAVSVAKDGMRLLCELSAREIADLREERPPEPAPSFDGNSSFWKRFSHNMKIQMKLLPKDTPPARPYEPNPVPEPSPFALALLRAQSENDKDGLINLLNTLPDPNSEPDDRDDGRSGSGGVQDYNAAIEKLKQMGDPDNRKVDELFDRISKRSDRYSKKG